MVQSVRLLLRREAALRTSPHQSVRVRVTVCIVECDKCTKTMTPTLPTYEISFRQKVYFELEVVLEIFLLHETNSKLPY